MVSIICKIDERIWINKFNTDARSGRSRMSSQIDGNEGIYLCYQRTNRDVKDNKTCFNRVSSTVANFLSYFREHFEFFIEMLICFVAHYVANFILKNSLLCSSDSPMGNYN